MEARKYIEIKTASAVETESLGEAIGRHLRGGETIELTSDLGGGKTTLVRGLARGAGSNDHVASPTFTLSKLYQAGNIQIHHFDFYRLSEAGIMREEVQELIGDPEAVLLVEWSDVVKLVLPEERLTITLTATGEDSRTVGVAYPPSLAYLTEELEP